MNRRKLLTENEAETVRRALGVAPLNEESPTLESDRSVFAEAVGIAIRELFDEQRAEGRAALDQVRREVAALQTTVAELRVAIADYRVELSGGKAMPPWPKREPAGEAFVFAREKSPDAPAADPALPDDPPPLRRDLN
jgi:hypothetical protein